jgi:glycosyltransferase involved in cell wall biosynthesis
MAPASPHRAPASATRISAGHVLTMAQHLRGGGVERATLRLARGWLAAGRRVTLVAGSLDGPLAAELPPGIETVELGAASVWPLLALSRVVRERGCDLIFCPGNFYTGITAWTKLRLGRRTPPIVAKMSNAADRGDHGAVAAAGHRLWLAQHGRFLDWLVAMTPATAAAAERALHMAGRVSVIPNPPVTIAAGALQPTLPAGRFILGVGRLVPQKRWDRLIAAMPLLATRDVSLVILGEGERRSALEAQVRRLSLEARVTLPGHSGDPMGAMARAAAVVLASDYEGVPGVLREALSVGTPVVSTESAPSVAEIIASPDLGSIVPRDDPAALVAALDRWLDPAAVRPAPVPQPGADSAARYLDLFDRLVSRRV